VIVSVRRVPWHLFKRWISRNRFRRLYRQLVASKCPDGVSLMPNERLSSTL